MTLYPSTTPPQTTAIYRDFKKSTAISKGYNVGLRYIKKTSKQEFPQQLTEPAREIPNFRHWGGVIQKQNKKK